MSKKSERLFKGEIKKLKALTTGYGQTKAVAEKLGVSRITIFNVLTKGSGKPSTVKAIRKIVK